jgi:phosphohistidine swiveling domain-containing protein
MNLEEIVKVDWIKTKERDIDVAIQSFYMIGHAKKYFKNNGVNFQVLNQIAFGDGRMYFDKKELGVATKLLEDQGENLGQFADNFTKQFLLIADGYERFLNGLPQGELDKSDLLDIYKVYLEHVYAFVPYSFLVSMTLEDVAHKKIIEALAGYENPEAIYGELVISNEETLTQAEQKARKLLAAKLNAQNFDLKKALQEHIIKYGWLSCYRPTDAPMNEDDLLSDLKSITVKSSSNSHSKSEEVTVGDFKLSGDNKLIIEVMKKNSWIRTYRRELMCKGFYLFQPIYRKIAQLIGIDFIDLRYLACWEIPALIQGNNLNVLDQIALRKKNFVVIALNGDYQVLSGDEATKINFNQKEVKTDKLSGMEVFPGKLVGVVRIIKSNDEMKDFQRGEILVAPTVATWMTPVVEKCAGILTDAGGVLSHTAIVAREFRKPCIVGLKEATTFLKNGDKIELDTKNGVKLI